MKNDTILLVEDDARLSAMLKKVLEWSGFTVETVSNGKLAWEYLHQHEVPALILLDIMMPVMSGEQLLHKLHAAGKLQDLPIVVLSAIADDNTFHFYGCRTLRKPVSLSTLVNLAKQYCPACVPHATYRAT